MDKAFYVSLLLNQHLEMSDVKWGTWNLWILMYFSKWKTNWKKQFGYALFRKNGKAVRKKSTHKECEHLSCFCNPFSPFGWKIHQNPGLVSSNSKCFFQSAWFCNGFCRQKPKHNDFRGRCDFSRQGSKSIDFSWSTGFTLIFKKTTWVLFFEIASAIKSLWVGGWRECPNCLICVFADALSRALMMTATRHSKTFHTI